MANDFAQGLKQNPRRNPLSMVPRLTKLHFPGGAPGRLLERALLAELRTASAIVVPNVPTDTRSPAGLHAWLFGLRIADEEWVRSTMTRGNASQLGSRLRRNMALYGFAQFRAQRPAHADVLN